MSHKCISNPLIAFSLDAISTRFPTVKVRVRVSRFVMMIVSRVRLVGFDDDDDSVKG